MYTHDMRRQRERRPRGQGCFTQRHWTQEGGKKERRKGWMEGGGRVEDEDEGEDEKEWLLELLHKVNKCEEAALYNVPLQLRGVMYRSRAS